MNRTNPTNLLRAALTTFLILGTLVAVLLFLAHKSLQSHPIEGVVVATSHEPAKTIKQTLPSARGVFTGDKAVPECYRVDYTDKSGKSHTSCVHQWEWKGLKVGDKFTGTNIPSPPL